MAVSGHVDILWKKNQVSSHQVTSFLMWREAFLFRFYLVFSRKGAIINAKGYTLINLLIKIINDKLFKLPYSQSTRPDIKDCFIPILNQLL